VKVAPFSWLAQNDIDEARHRVDFSNWNGRLTVAGFQRAVRGGMPPVQFTLFHPNARLTEAARLRLVQGFQESWNANQDTTALASAATATGVDAAAVIQVRCGLCHSVNSALRFHASGPNTAKALIDRMVQHGAVITPAEEQVMIRRFIG
jgi:mono/diheme cytochrome c family protein